MERVKKCTSLNLEFIMDNKILKKTEINVNIHL